MKAIFENIRRMLKEHPLRSFLSLFSMFAGAFLLASAWGISDSIQRLSSIAQEKDGVLISMANGEISKDGTFARKFPGQFDAQIVQSLTEGLTGVKNISPITQVPFRRIQIAEKVFQVRNVLGVNENYLALMDLRLISGSNISQEEIKGKEKVILISKEIATSLFGSAEASIGKSIDFLQGGGGNAGGNRQNDTANNGRNQEIPKQSFSVIGVYDIPSENFRTENGIADILLSYSGASPGGVNVPDSFFWNTIVFRAQVTDLQSATQSFGQYLTSRGKDIQFVMWQGNPLEPNFKASSTNAAMKSLMLLITAMGIILVLVSGVGIYGIMTVEIAGRVKEYGIRKALGFDNGQILRLIISQALIFSFIGSLIGLILSMILNQSIVGALTPWFEKVGLPIKLIADLGINVLVYIVSLFAIAFSVIIFSIIPALKILKVQAINLLREEGI